MKTLHLHGQFTPEQMGVSLLFNHNTEISVDEMTHFFTGAIIQILWIQVAIGYYI